MLRDGEMVATRDKASVDRRELIRLMVGRDLTAMYPRRSGQPGGVALEIRGLSSRASGLHDISLFVRHGEILGVAGLVGSGRTELAETIFGIRPADTGTVLVDGAAVRIDETPDAIAYGIAYVPEDRRQHGVVLPMSVAANSRRAQAC